MLLRTLVVVGLAGFGSLTAGIAAAQSPPAQNTGAAVNGVSLADPLSAIERGGFSFNVEEGAPGRFTAFTPATLPGERDEAASRRVEVTFVTRAPAGMDFALAQRGAVGFDASGDLSRQSRSSELRLGRGLSGMRDAGPSATPRWYFFAAAEDEALIWSPGRQTNAFGGSARSLALQDRVEIGDLQAGITYEVHGVQASLAYVEREISVHSGAYEVSQDQRFAGITLTMRR